MRIRFEATGANAEAELHSLYRWLRDDRALRREAEIDKAQEQSSDRMGPELEAVLAVVSTAAALSQLPFSYLAWREGRRPRAEVTITVLASDEGEAREMRRRLEARSTAHGAGEGPEEEPAANQGGNS